jgi:hypothetical protein
MDFSEALRIVKAGGRARRKIWPQHGAWGVWMVMRELPGVTALVVEYGDGSIQLFAGANWDLLADDWESDG